MELDKIMICTIANLGPRPTIKASIRKHILNFAMERRIVTNYIPMNLNKSVLIKQVITTSML